MTTLRAHIELLRLHKPVGMVLLGWPGLWGLMYAYPQGIPLRWLSIFAAGTLITRAAGCALNDWADRDIDGQVSRTKDRPLADGRLPAQHALWLFSGGMLLATGLWLLLPFLAKIIALAAALLLMLYPFSKRFFFAPQAILGLAFASPVLIAFATHYTYLPREAWVLFCLAWSWTMGYDSLYAMHDKQDDLVLPIHSLPKTLGRFDWWGCITCYLLCFLCLGYLGYLFTPKTSYMIACLALLLCAIPWLARCRHDASYGFQAFRHNQWWGGLVSLALFINLTT